MEKAEVIARLRAHEFELKDAGIAHLHLHGSVVRRENGPGSDVDLAAQFDRVKVRTMLAEIGLKNRLSDILGMDADLADVERLKQVVQTNFDREAEIVF